MKKGDTILKKANKEMETPEITARVNWCVGNTMGITYLSPEDWASGGGMNVVEIVEGEWVIISEGVGSFKDEVASLSDEELRARIEELRGVRKAVPKKVSGESGLGNKDMELLSKLTPEQLTKLRSVLGL